MGKVVTILVAGVILIGGITLLAMNRTSVAFIDRCVHQHDHIRARSNAISVANMAVGALVRGEQFQEVSNVPFYSTRVSLDTFALTANRIKIIAKGYIPGKDTVVVEVTINFQQSSLSFDMRAAVVACCNLDTRGSLVIDGRNHDLDGVFIPQTGTLAISTIKKFQRQQFSTIGGTYDDTDYSPQISYPQYLVEEWVAWEGGFPDTPDRIFGGEEAGFPEGRLKEIAQSGIDGSQYVTNPADLIYPLTSLTYVDLPPGGGWNNIDLGVGKGILIVHNNQGNARVENLWRGSFTGIIIADRISQIENQIVGGIFQLSQAASKWEGDGTIRFSREAIAQALGMVQQEGSEEPLIVAWYE